MKVANEMLALARAQLGGRLASLAAALLVGFVPVVVAHIYPDVAAAGPSLVVFIWAVSQIVVLFIGMSVFGEDLSSGRLAFFFARPVGAFTVWVTWLGTALVFAMAVEALLLGPTLLFWPLTFDFGYVRATLASFSMTPAQLVAICALILTGGAMVSIVGRIRNRWLILDAAATAAVIVVIIVSVRTVTAANLRLHAAWQDAADLQLRRHVSGLSRLLYDRTELVEWSVVVMAILCFVAATAAALVVGRASPRRAHRAASIALWSTALPSAAAVAAYIRWFLPPL